MKSTKIALVQAGSQLFDLKKTLQKLEDFLAMAAKQGAQLVLFPESFLPGYPRGLGFGAVVGQRTNEGREQWLAYWQSAVALGDPTFLKLSRLAAEYHLFLAVGVTEKVERTGSMYCAFWMFSPEGELLLHHRKIKPTASERLIWAEGDGKSIVVRSTSIGKIGGLICWENYMPSARMRLYAQGIELYLAPTADQRDTWQASVRHIAFEGRCYVMSCNQFSTKADYPDWLQPLVEKQPEILCRGGSVVVSPMGQIIAGPAWDSETILYADIHLQETVKAKFDFAPAGHYYRPDIFGEL